MKILHQDIYEHDEDGDGHITIELNGYIYRIGQMDNECFYIERQSVDDDHNGRDGYEYPEWSSPSKKRHAKFKFLNKNGND